MMKIMNSSQPNQGFAIHCHHQILMEYCYDYNERVRYIKEEKLKNEQEIRLRLFKILPKSVLKEIPKYYQKADAKWKKADAKLEKACAEWEKACARWPQKSKNAFHQKWCRCKEWQNGKLNFESSNPFLK